MSFMVIFYFFRTREYYDCARKLIVCRWRTMEKIS